MCTDNLTVMRELVSILRGENPAWKGDRIRNAEEFAYLLRRDHAEVSVAIADDLDRNVRDYSDELGVSPDRVRWIARRLTVPETAP